MLAEKNKCLQSDIQQAVNYLRALDQHGREKRPFELSENASRLIAAALAGSKGSKKSKRKLRWGKKQKNRGMA